MYDGRDLGSVVRRIEIFSDFLNMFSNWKNPIKAHHFRVSHFLSFVNSINQGVPVFTPFCGSWKNTIQCYPPSIQFAHKV